MIKKNYGVNVKNVASSTKMSQMVTNFDKKSASYN